MAESGKENRRFGTEAERDEHISGKENAMKKTERMKGIAAYLAIAVMIIGTIGTAGCGRTGMEEDAGLYDGTSEEENPGGGAAGSGDGMTGDGTDGSAGGQEGAGGGGDIGEPGQEKVMGRYLESVDETLKGEMGAGGKIVQLEDGSLVIMAGNTGKWVSEDGGMTWEREKMAWHEKLLADGCWIMDTAVAKNGDIAVIYAGGTNGEKDDGEDAGEEKSSHTFLPKYGIASPDGTFKEWESPYKDSEYVRTLVFSEDGRLFGSSLGGMVYEIDRETGAAEELLELQDWAEYMTEKDGQLILLNSGGVIIFDPDTGETTEDQVMNDFLHDRLGSHISSDTEGVVPLLLLPGDNGILYLVFENGIYRHVMEGNVIEQAADGTLTSLSDPSCEISDGVLLENDVFLLLLSDGRLMRYTYDPDMPAKPEVQLTAYSLRDNSKLKKVISAFQSEHPEIYIRYETGMEDNSPVTREDALKKLNTEIAAGKGPDIFILDDMPIDSYAEKGVLMDLSTWLEKKTEDRYFTNVLNALCTPEGTYAVPSQFQIGLAVGRQEDIEKMTGLEAMAGLTEEYDAEKGDGLILGVGNENELINMLLPACLPAWTEENGKIDKEALTEFFTLAKKMWEMEEARMSEEQKEWYEKAEEDWRAAGIPAEQRREFQMRLNEVGWLTGETAFEVGLMTDSGSFDMLISCFKVPGKEDGGFAAYNGQAKGVFRPESLLGIAATSRHQETALELMEKMLDDDGWLGMPVNREKWTETFHKRPTESGSYASMGGSRGDEKEEYYHLDIYPASEEEVERLLEIVEAGSVPYIRDSVLENAVCETGVKVLAGKMSASAGAEEVIRKTAIYMAE